MRNLLLLFLPALLHAATAVVTNATSTQAIAVIKGATGTCTGTLTRADGEVHPSVNGVDLSTLPDYFTRANGARVVTLGQQEGGGALRAESSYTLETTGAGCTASVTFQTGAPPWGTRPARSVPFDAAKYGNRNWPEIDWTLAGKNNVYTDSLSGLPLKILPRTGDNGFTSNTGGKAFASYYAQGSGWTNPDRVANGSLTNYGTITGSTNPVDIFPPMNGAPFSGNGIFAFPNATLDNLGIIAYCSGDDATAANRTARVSLVNAAGVIGYVDIECAQGSVAHKQSDSADPDKPWPAEFLDGGFNGWNGGRITRDMMPSDGTATVSSGSTVTISSPAAGNHIPYSVAAGSKILLTGSSCTNGLCTVAANTNAAGVTISETVTNGDYPFAVYPFWLRVEKTTATGTLNIGLKWKAQGTKAISAGTAYAALCAQWELTEGDTDKPGSVCGIGGNDWYFVSDDLSVIRYVSMFATQPAKFSSMDAADRMSTAIQTPTTAVYPDPSAANTWYWMGTVSGGKQSLFRITYGGDYSAEYAPGLKYRDNNSFDGADLPALDGMTWENLMKPSGGAECGRAAGTGCDLAAQAAALQPSGDEWDNVNWNGTVGFAGVSGTKAFFYKMGGVSGVTGDSGPCLIAVFELTTTRITKVFSTAQGIPEDLPANARWGACHSVQPSQMWADTLMISMNSLGTVGFGGGYGGPFELTPAAKKNADGTWNSNTSLEWPIGDAGNTYLKTCPEDIPQWLKDYGATGNQCVTFKIPHDPCFTLPNTDALAGQPACPSDAADTMPQALRVGDRLENKAHTTGEYFRVVKITALSGTEKEIVVSRNGVWDYCCRHDATDSPRSSYCTASDAQMTHANGFTWRMLMGQTNSCGAASLDLVFNSAGTITYSGEGNHSGGGHSTTGMYTQDRRLFVGTTGQILSSASDLHTPYPVISSTVTTNGEPKFAGITAGIGNGYLQQYLSRTHGLAADADLSWTSDANAMNNSNGTATLGSRTLTAVGGMTDVYEIQPLGTLTNAKKQALIGWAGYFAMKDRSGTGDVDDMPAFSICHNYAAGACGTGTINKTYVKLPKAYSGGACETGNSWAAQPCVYWSQAGIEGWTRRFVSDTEMPLGQHQQLLTMGLAGPGLPPGYWQTRTNPKGTWGAVYSGSLIDGVRPAVVLYRMPSYLRPANPRYDFGGLKVKIGPRAGMTHARVRFGHDPSTFACTERAEACLTDASVTPFAYADSDSLTPVSCSGGCTINVKATPGRLTYYRVETYNGSSWTNGETLTAVPK